MSFKKHKGKANDQHRKHPQEKKKGKGKGEKGEFGTKNAVELRWREVEAVRNCNTKETLLSLYPSTPASHMPWHRP